MADQWGTILTAVEAALANVSELSGVTIERRERVTFDAERDTLASLCSAIRSVRINELSPLEAMAKLYELQRLAKS